MKAKRFIMIIACVLTAAFLLAACASSETPETDSEKVDTVEPVNSDTAPAPETTEESETESETEEATTPVSDGSIYHGFTAEMLDAIPSVGPDAFQNQMEAGWNFGWEGNGTLDYNATKVDFAGNAPADKLIWRLGSDGAEGSVMVDNAGWGVILWSNGEGNVSYMYNKVSVPENVGAFRVWAVSNTSEHWSGAGAVRAVALYKDNDGNYVKKVLTPQEESFTGDHKTVFYPEDGTVRFSDAVWNMPDTLDGCMIIYDASDLIGREDVIIFVESVGIGQAFGDEFTEAAEGVPEGQVMPDVVIVKRVMFI